MSRVLEAARRTPIRLTSSKEHPRSWTAMHVPNWSLSILGVISLISASGCVTIFDAVRAGDIDKVNALLRKDRSLANAEQDSVTPLCTAAKHAEARDAAIVKALISAGADSSVPCGPLKRTALMEAVTSIEAYSYANFELAVIQTLLASNAEVNETDAEGFTALALLVRQKAPEDRGGGGPSIRINGANPCTEDCRCRTTGPIGVSFLIAACLENHPALARQMMAANVKLIAQELLDAGAKVSPQVIEDARSNGYGQVVELLLAPQPDNPPRPRFIWDEDVVTDRKTGLEWQRSYSESMSVAEILCGRLDSKGRGWRVPTLEEAQTLLPINLGAFPDPGVRIRVTQDRFINFFTGKVSRETAPRPRHLPTYGPVRCVRGVAK